MEPGEEKPAPTDALAPLWAGLDIADWRQAGVPEPLVIERFSSGEKAGYSPAR
ncbi:MAG: hypothetical protein PHV33_10870 [Elusimicrobiales bacterium]|nr:hypothetical protein [Elusimicrobiales bacterium]